MKAETPQKYFVQAKGHDGKWYFAGLPEQTWSKNKALAAAKRVVINGYAARIIPAPSFITEYKKKLWKI